jgi:hypothetical protein
MEHGRRILLNEEDILVRDQGFDRFVGYNQANAYNLYFNTQTVSTISKKITELLSGVDRYNRPIIVPDKTILDIMDTVKLYFRPQTGDIYSRYNIPNGENCPSYIQQMVDQVIEIIVSDVRNNLETEEYNSTLTVWTTLFGDFNEKGLRSHSVIKTKERRVNPFQFNMNY